MKAKGKGKGDSKGNTVGEPVVSKTRGLAPPPLLTPSGLPPTPTAREKAAAAAESRLSLPDTMPDVAKAKAIAGAAYRAATRSGVEIIRGGKDGGMEDPPVNGTSMGATTGGGGGGERKRAGEILMERQLVRRQEEMETASTTWGTSAAASSAAASFAPAAKVAWDIDLEQSDNEEQSDKKKEDDVDSGKETEHSSVRTSKSKMGFQKSSGTQRKKLERYRKDFEARGGVWVEKERNVVAPTVIVDGMEIDDPEEQKVLQLQIKKSADRAPLLDMRERLMVDISEFFKADFEEKCDSEWKLKECEDRHIVPFGEWQQPYCLLCSKYSNDTHLCSLEHKKRVNETACCDSMVGWALSTRRHSRHAGLPGRCTPTLMRQFWGHSVDSRMVALIWSRLEQGAKFQVDMSPEWGQQRGKPWYKEFGLKEVKDITFAAVSYIGTGKYQEIDRALPWDELLNEEHESNIESIEQKDVGDLHFERLVDDNYHKQKDGEGFGRPVDANRGWWPISIVHWWNEARDHGMADELEYLHQQRLGLRPEYALCWYQLTNGQWILTLWRVITRSRL